MDVSRKKVYISDLDKRPPLRFWQVVRQYVCAAYTWGNNGYL